MKARQNFLKYIREANNILSPLDIPDNGLSQLKKDIEQAELIVPVVGGFSAGKSTLINSFLGLNILPTAITPETALATELRYSTNDYIEAVTANGSVERHELSDFPKLKDNAQNFRYLRLYLNNENLKAIQPLVLVDMPGFDAPIENHNQAILNYLERGVFFIFLTSVEDGNITHSMKRQIENLQQFGKGFSFCISKTNLRAPDDVQTVKENIAEQLEIYFDHTDDLILLDDNGGNNLKNILTAIDPEALFSKLFLDDLKIKHLAAIQSINLKISTFNGTKEDAEQAIQSLQNSINNLISQKETALSDIEKRYSHGKVETISQKVAHNLLLNKENLIDLALQNTSYFSRELNDLVQNSLLSESQRNFKEISNLVLHDFTTNLRLSLAENQNPILDEALAYRMQEQAQNLLNRASSSVINWSDGITKKDKEQEDIRKIYRAVATIAGLATSVVAPVLEVVIVFLPDIIQFLRKASIERKRRQEVEQKIIREVIPAIKDNIKQSLPEAMTGQISVLIQQISEQFETQLQQKRDEVTHAEAEKSQYIDEMKERTHQLEAAKKSLDTIATQYLFN